MPLFNRTSMRSMPPRCPRSQAVQPSESGASQALGPDAGDAGPDPVRTSENPADPSVREAVIVFIDCPATWWLRVLRPGFRHCFAAVRQDEATWLVCDPLKDGLELAALHLPANFDLAAHYRAAGHRVLVGTTLARPSRRWPPVPEPLTCVAVVKRLVGLRSATVLTPFQLYRRLSALGPVPFIEPASIGMKSLDTIPLGEY